ncbi:MAG: hypothetical protein OWS74_00770, partial [Firmicutes bacterium]|nr:hypothetical protein [Bacillota bacterium]
MLWGDTPSLFSSYAQPLLNVSPPLYHALQLKSTDSAWIVYDTAADFHLAIDKSTAQIHLAGRTGIRQDFFAWCRALSSRWVTLTMPSHSLLYGLGEKTGGLDKSGRFWQQWATETPPTSDSADPLYQAIPFAIWANPQQAGGLFAAGTARSYWDAESMPEGKLSIGLDDGALDMYWLPGPQVADVVRQYTTLTGTMHLPPIWALGFQQSRYSYLTQDSVLEIARQFRRRHLPLDALYLDIDYMNGFRLFTWDARRFPRPQEMTRALQDQGIQTVAIIDPGVKVDAFYSMYAEGSARQLFMQYRNGQEFHSRVWPGLCAFPNFLSAKTRAWWSQANAQFVQENRLAGLWNDMNEPALWGDD